METLSSPGGKMTDYYKALTTEAPSVNVNRIEFTMSLKIANLRPGDATATSGRESREQNCPCFQGWRDTLILACQSQKLYRIMGVCEVMCAEDCG